MAKGERARIKDPDRYEAMRREGMSQEKAARIANTDAHKAGERGGHAENYDRRTKPQLLERAREIGLDVKSTMKKAEIIDRLRNH